MFKYTLPATEDLTIKLPEPTLSSISEIHNEILPSLKSDSGRYILEILDESTCHQYYAVFAEGGLISKKFEFVDGTKLSFDAFLALRQFFFLCRAAMCKYNFNIVDILITYKGNKIEKIQYSTSYDESFDPGAKGGASHAAPGPMGVAVDKKLYNNVSSNKNFSTSRVESAKLMPLKV